MNKKKQRGEILNYNCVNFLFQNNFTNEICNILNKSKIKRKINIFDIGSYMGNFSREIKIRIKKHQLNFYLFDPNPFIKLNDFKYNCIGLSNIISKKTYNYNNFFPSSGSGFNKITSNDFLWNISRKLITFNIFKKFSEFKVYTNTLDNFCKKKIKKIDVLKIDTEGHELEVLKGGKKILNNTKIIQIEIMETKKKFKKKFTIINNFLKKYHFEILKKKKIWSVSIFSNIKAIDILYVKNITNGINTMKN
jgi:FkbM family methyltransferase